MKRHPRLHLIATLFVGATAFASPARAETLFVPWLGANTGGNASATFGFGASIGTSFGGVIGGDLDIGSSSGIFEGYLNSHLVTVMGNVTAGIPFDGARRAGLRPYVTAGIGAMHTRLDDPRFGGSFTSTNLGVNAGGGVMTFFGRHLGVRADLRYMKSLGNSSGIDDVHFWRTSLGVTLR